jgi:hypothetical protein
MKRVAPGGAPSLEPAAARLIIPAPPLTGCKLPHGIRLNKIAARPEPEEEKQMAIVAIQEIDAPVEQYDQVSELIPAIAEVNPDAPQGAGARDPRGPRSGEVVS